MTQDSYQRQHRHRQSYRRVSLDLSLDEAVARGLRQNLGLFCRSRPCKPPTVSVSRSSRPFSRPLNGRASIEVEQINLAAFGSQVPRPQPYRRIVPGRRLPRLSYANLFNARPARTTSPPSITSRAPGSPQRTPAALVVLTVGNATCSASPTQARIEAVNAELDTSKSHSIRRSPRTKPAPARGSTYSGPRSTTRTSSRALSPATTALAKDKIALARAIGLPLDQSSRLPDRGPYQGARQPRRRKRFTQALKSRKDLAAYARAGRKPPMHRRPPPRPTSIPSPAHGDYGDTAPPPATPTAPSPPPGRSTVPVLQIAKTRRPGCR